jgi:hypothetical protein
MTGQITVTHELNDGVSSDDRFNSEDVDLNTIEDYAEHKDEIKSVDGIAIVAIVENRSTEESKAAFFISDDPSIDTIDDLRDPDQATLVFISPTIPAKSKMKIEWAEGFEYMINEQAVIDQVLGDGVFTVYGVAKETPFDLYIKGEIAITVTVGK